MPVSETPLILALMCRKVLALRETNLRDGTEPAAGATAAACVKGSNVSGSEIFSCLCKSHRKVATLF